MKLTLKRLLKILRNFSSMDRDDASRHSQRRAFVFLFFGLLSGTHLAMAFGCLLTVTALWAVGAGTGTPSPPAAVQWIFALGGTFGFAWAWLASSPFRRFLRWAEGSPSATESIST